MQCPLAGRTILIIEDEPLIAIDVQDAFQDAGATAIVARTLSAALVEVEQPDLSAAIVDHALSDGDSSELCERLTARNIPFVTYSGFPRIDGACGIGVHVNKPASASVLVTTVAGLIASRQISN